MFHDPEESILEQIYYRYFRFFEVRYILYILQIYYRYFRFFEVREHP
jgi:hypothetical protein